LCNPDQSRLVHVLNLCFNMQIRYSYNIKSLHRNSQKGCALVKPPNTVYYASIGQLTIRKKKGLTI
jgi:hypothetical protein